VPLKVSIFAWRLLQDRLPTKSNMLNRGIISRRQVFARQVVVMWRMHNIYFFHEVLSAPVASGALVDWHSKDGSSGSPGSFHSIHLRFRWFESATLVSSASLALVCVVGME
jgi:hypothetical protein